MTADGFDLSVWELPALELIARKKGAVRAPFLSLAPINFHGDAAVISGTDSCHRGRHTEEHVVRIWRTVDLTLLWGSGAPELISAETVRAFRIDNAEWILIRDSRGTVLLLNPATGAKVIVTSWYEGISHFIGLMTDEHGALLIGLYYGRLRVFRFRHGVSEERAPLVVEQLPITTEVLGNAWGAPVELRGRRSLVSAHDRQVRVWDLEELCATNEREGARDAGILDLEGMSVVAVAADGEIVVAAGDATLWAWSTEGKPLWHRHVAAPFVRDLAVTWLDGEQTIVWATSGGALQCCRGRDGTEVREAIKTGCDVLALVVRPVQGRPTAFAAVNLHDRGHSGHYVVRVWDLLTGDEINTQYTERDLDDLAIVGYEDKTLWCVEALAWQGTTVVVYAGPNGEVRAKALGSSRTIDAWDDGCHDDYVYALGAGVCSGRPLVFSGNENGILLGRDIALKKDIAPPVQTPHRGITTLCLHRATAGDYVVSGGQEGVVNVWTTELIHLARIETERPVNDLISAGPDHLIVANDRGVTFLRVDWGLLSARGSRRA